MSTTISPINYSYRFYQPCFKSKVVDKVDRFVEYIDCAVQEDYPPPNIYRQLLPVNYSDVLKTITIDSTNPTKDLKEAYNLYEKDFSSYENYTSYKRFKNNLVLDQASVFVLKSNDETVGFYSLSINNDDTMYISYVDLLSKYRNTRQGNEIIKTCWKNINKLALRNNCSKIGLHVDANKRQLVNMYKRLGFSIIENKSSKYPTGQRALYMERMVDKDIC